MIKTTQIMQRFRELGPEKAAIITLTEIIEHISAMNEQMNELTRTCDKMIDMLGATASGYSDLRKNVERIRNKIPEDEQQ